MAWRTRRRRCGGFSKVATTASSFCASRSNINRVPNGSYVTTLWSEVAERGLGSGVERSVVEAADCFSLLSKSAATRYANSSSKASASFTSSVPKPSVNQP
jgi:hypothetical protein